MAIADRSVFSAVVLRISHFRDLFDAVDEGSNGRAVPRHREVYPLIAGRRQSARLIVVVEPAVRIRVESRVIPVHGVRTEIEPESVSRTRRASVEIHRVCVSDPARRRHISPVLNRSRAVAGGQVSAVRPEIDIDARCGCIAIRPAGSGPGAVLRERQRVTCRAGPSADPSHSSAASRHLQPRRRSRAAPRRFRSQRFPPCHQRPSSAGPRTPPVAGTPPVPGAPPVPVLPPVEVEPPSSVEPPVDVEPPLPVAASRRTRANRRYPSRYCRSNSRPSQALPSSIKDSADPKVTKRGRLVTIVYELPRRPASGIGPFEPKMVQRSRRPRSAPSAAQKHHAVQAREPLPAM